jgi:apolipoprotein N-acyltransferase
VVTVPTPLREIAPLIGTYGLSALVILLSAAVWLEFYRKWLPILLIGGATLILWALPSSSVPEHSLSLRPIRVVQPNIGQQDKWRPGFSEVAAQRLAQLSMQPGGTHPRLLFWPEAAVTNPLEDHRTEPYNAFATFERQRAAAVIGPGEYVLTGGIALFSRDGRNLSGAANSVFVLGQGGNVVGRYDKAHLVPYGEYLPMRPLLSAIGLSRLAPGDVDFASGPGPRTLALPSWGNVGFQLCYEIIFSGEVVDRKNRPDFIFNPSNDAWFGSWGPPQHLAQARLRATEEGLPVIRSTPTGISAVVDGRGRIVASRPAQKAAFVDTVMPAASNRLTPFARFGNVIPLLIGFGLILAGIALARRGRYRHRT